jgi:hypothetical protein
MPESPFIKLHLSDFKSKSNPTVEISALKTGTRKIGAVDDSHYTKEEYESLKHKQKKDLASKCLKRKAEAALTLIRGWL